ncbi:hypothetical protein Afil01_01530 [Actinorhabdospora filicis]|uniref:Uncharacterized protein n=1 Tax=Actinorhabdospora filicis TaxID=1785913 RepID=A0A9W6SH52_9ACTN|nr:hypothetical protein Afil01_01530 [Actinorhabdospora filicis]
MAPFVNTAVASHPARARDTGAACPGTPPGLTVRIAALPAVVRRDALARVGATLSGNDFVARRKPGVLVVT